jgi:hypothetical protein
MPGSAPYHSGVCGQFEVQSREKYIFRVMSTCFCRESCKRGANATGLPSSFLAFSREDDGRHGCAPHARHPTVLGATRLSLFDSVKFLLSLRVLHWVLHQIRPWKRNAAAPSLLNFLRDALLLHALS